MAEDVKIYVTETVERVEIKISDPFPTNVLPTGTLEINDVKANTLVSDVDGGSIPAEIYSWFKDKFALLVDKLLSSWVHGLIFITKAIDEALTSLQSTVSEHATSLEVIDGRVDDIEQNVTLLDGRIEELENDEKLILSYVVPVDASMVELTTDKYGRPFNFQEGEEIEISFRIKPFPGGFNSRINMRVNGIETANYNWANGYGFTYIATAGSNYYGQSTVLKLKIIVGELNGYMMTMPFTGENTLISTQAYGISSQGLNLSAINSIKLWSQGTTVVPAGFTVLVKKL